MANENVIYFPWRGVNQSIQPSLANAEMMCRATNVAINKQLPTNRHGTQVVKLTGGGAEAFKQSAIQGGCFYDPSQGISAQKFGKDRSGILIVASGKKFLIRPTRNGSPAASASVEDVTAVEPSSPNLQMAWVWQAENYVFSNDGAADCWIWDGADPAFKSPGTNELSPEESRIPNGGTVGVYSHGRVSVVVNGSQINVGNSVHSENQSSAQDLLKFSESEYWATGGWFAPPSNMGAVTAAAILPLRNTQMGQAETLFHTANGVFSIDFNIYPREKWVDTPMVKHLLLGTGAIGPYALTLYDGDQFFRSRHGVQNLRSTAAESQLLGNPMRPISEPMEDNFQSDPADALRFCAMVKASNKKRLYCTTGLRNDGAYRGARGMASLNFAPSQTDKQATAWEGLWTFPAKYGKIAHVVSGIFDEKERVFIFFHGGDGVTRMVEMDDILDDDRDENGDISEISSQIITRAVGGPDVTTMKNFREASIQFQNVAKNLVFGVWARIDENGKWVYWASGKIDKGCPEGLCMDNTGVCEKDIGDPPPSIKSGRTLQILVRWRGKATLRGISLKSEFDAANKFHLIECPPLECVLADYNDFEYNESTPERWEDTIP